MGLEPNQDFAARCIEAYKEKPEILFIANRLDVDPVEVSRTLRKSGILTEIQWFEVCFIAENNNAMPARAIAEYLGLTPTQLGQAQDRYDTRGVRKVHMTRETCIAMTRWLIEKQLKFPINDHLPRVITNDHFTKNDLNQAVEFATANKAECSTARHFSACAFLICEAYPGHFKPWQFRHAKKNTFFSGEDGRKNFLNALLWLIETRTNATRQTLHYGMKSHTFLNASSLQQYGLGAHEWRKHWSNKDEMLAAFAKAAEVTPVGHCSQSTARVRAQPHATGTHRVVHKATGQTSDFTQSRPTLPPYPALTPPAKSSDSVELLEKVKTIIAREFDPSRGSQTQAKAFRKRHPEYNISLKILEVICNEIRGETLPRGRPRTSRRDVV